MSRTQFGLVVAEPPVPVLSAQLDSLFNSTEEALVRAEAALRRFYTLPSLVPRPQPLLEAIILDHYPKEQNRY